MMLRLYKKGDIDFDLLEQILDDSDDADDKDDN
jgi:hypothetical protein